MLINIFVHFLLFVHILAYENLALNKSAWQAHSYTGKEILWGAAKAVDGLYNNRDAGGNQCTISANGQSTATWGVDLGSVMGISHINIYYRTGNKPSPGVFYNRFAGFFLYVSNSSENNDHRCFHEIQNVNGTPIENQTISCPVHGRYIIYYNERKSENIYPEYYSEKAYNELCELEVIGCPFQGYYGPNCSQVCPDNCQEQRCDVITGDCLGCIPGYQGRQCKQNCDTQTYGLECSLSCGNCSDGDTCHHVNGTCLKGCSEGVEGDNCTTACKAGHYGRDCRYECSKNCGVPRQCNRFTGECKGGCQPGWKGIRCDEECDGGMYGNKCNQSCGHCLDELKCHHINGTCLEGCSSGYEGPLCSKVCGQTFWGINCGWNCSTDCVNHTCHHVSGKCLDYVRAPQDNKANSTIGGVVGGIVAAIVVIIIVVIALILFRRSRSLKERHQGNRNSHHSTANTNLNAISKSKKKNFTEIYENMEAVQGSKENKNPRTILSSGQESHELKTRKNDTDDAVDIDEKIHEENPYGDLYINEDSIPDIDFENLESVIREKAKEEDDGFKREYAAIPYGERHPCCAGKLQENISKNRFKTTFPYDHSRVKLSNRKSDYINANFIDSLEKKNAYIAAQGPKQSTRSDFWTMIWQENVRQIVILTNLKEGNKTKCVQYWPDLHQSTMCDVFSIRLEEEKIYAFYIIRKFKIMHKELRSAHVVTQYHYTAWPDHGTPEPLCLVVFHDYVTRTIEKRYGGPTLVHCSAGIGRTGTYIAIDALYKASKTERKVNIAKFVRTMRENRMNMVQTYEQYKTIFLVLNELFKASTAAQNKTEFVKKAESITRDKPANESELRKEFQNLLRIRPSYSEADYKNAVKNGKRNSTVLPVDKYSLFLSSSVPKHGSFINAITLQSYTSQNAFIVTHYPIPEDAVDFLRLLTDHESDIVICMDPLSEIDSSRVWLPDADGSKNISPFTVHFQQEKVTDVRCTTIHIVRKGINEETCSVAIVQPKCGLKLSEILGLVLFTLRSESEGPVTVVSRDGAALCGLFCAVHNVIQQLQVDSEVDIFSAVRQLQIRRPELCSSLEEYRMIYNSVLDYIRGQKDSSVDNIYCN